MELLLDISEDEKKYGKDEKERDGVAKCLG
jgi:hypothetical protein